MSHTPPLTWVRLTGGPCDGEAAEVPAERKGWHVWRNMGDDAFALYVQAESGELVYGGRTATRAQIEEEYRVHENPGDFVEHHDSKPQREALKKFR